MFKLISRYFHTLRYLKPVQWRYRIFYFIRNRWRKLTGFTYQARAVPQTVIPPTLIPSIRRPAMWQSDTNTFTFLGISADLGTPVNWKFNGYGKLWTYNLHYFEYLTCVDVDAEKALRLLWDFVDHLHKTPEANEPYPISLRLLFYIRFCAKHHIPKNGLDEAFYAQALALMDQQELHLLGNHYLENGFGLLFAAYRYYDIHMYRMAEGIITSELEEQILDDGGHFERSPMYHQIILYRLLDAINLAQHNRKVYESKLLDLMRAKAALMLGWLTQMTFSNGAVPLLNDTAFNIAPDTASLLKYANRLGILPGNQPLMDSGYRRMEGTAYQMIADVGLVGPDYIPGHAHSDTLHFELYVHGKPVIVDTGTSTYEKNERRQLERSTSSHNTVVVNNTDQTEIWGGFRVARRARPIVLHDTPKQLTATHTGYDRFNVRHVRQFTASDSNLVISDALKPLSDEGAVKATAFTSLHFHPDVKVIQHGDDYIQTDSVLIELTGADNLEILPYEYAPEFNQLQNSVKAVIHFNTGLVTKVTIT